MFPPGNICPCMLGEHRTWHKATPVYSLCSFRISRVAASLASDSDALLSGVTVLCTVLPGARLLSRILGETAARQCPGSRS
jgi:hypothetical protein